VGGILVIFLLFSTFVFSLRDNKGTKKLPFLLDKSHKSMIEMCVCSLCLSLACVMAGSGDIDCLRVFRELRWKIDDVTYGTHVALNMAIGKLVLSFLEI
jgi:amino acid transporter